MPRRCGPDLSRARRRRRRGRSAPAPLRGGARRPRNGRCISRVASAKANMLAALSTLGALTLIGLAFFVGALVLRRAPAAGIVIGAIIVGFGLGIPALVIN